MSLKIHDVDDLYVWGTEEKSQKPGDFVIGKLASQQENPAIGTAIAVYEHPECEGLIVAMVLWNPRPSHLRTDYYSTVAVKDLK